VHRSFGGKRLHLRLSAGGRQRRTAIFLHHGLGAIESWKALPACLRRAGGVRSLVYERWGYGRSEARSEFAPGFMEAEVPTLIEIVAAFSAGPVDLVGHSDGATIALLAAAEHPERVRSVVSIAAHTFVEPVTTSSIQALLEDAEANGAPGWLTRFHGERGLDLLRSWAEVWLGQVHGRWDVRQRLGEIRCPVLAIQGEADEFGSAEQLRVIGRRVPTAETWMIADAGHTPFVDEGAFARRIVDFWKRPPAAA
jgi:pimeloyl-ACP methyl ester carboxylesterase